jgi:hypothetical protein
VNNRIAAVLMLALCGIADAADGPRSYDDAEDIWLRSRDTMEYQRYAAEFAQYNNALGLDRRNGCYSLAPAGPVNLMLLISRADGQEFATIERVLFESDNAKARCFERSYSGIGTKVPPFTPFILQLRMG